MIIGPYLFPVTIVINNPSENRTKKLKSNKTNIIRYECQKNLDLISPGTREALWLQI